MRSHCRVAYLHVPRGRSVLRLPCFVKLPSRTQSCVEVTSHARNQLQGGDFNFAGANVEEMSLTLLLSLRFLAVVFEEVRNLALGLAARNLQWKAMERGAGIQVCSFEMHEMMFRSLNAFHPTFVTFVAFYQANL